ncbi:helix-turn-helix domain-containing protein [Sapientia aquatica]|jgi:DNA-binding XRE family transcriptional regulator|uniref:XRE family transcriptional regulator n=1 Tax=Sapientia aquatica TaxID=1549640 RepID=A0A4R5W5B4_9BURK|nr:helix-turn-helix transcriptional regulator [Sapientia aquatica]TDK68287.1 XRE family transcriptional regulator [Sapientia aquatica]
MKTLTDNVQILRDASGNPTFAVIPFAQYQALTLGKPVAEPTIPNHVVNAALDKGISAARAWREYLELTQAQVAQRMQITQSAYAQLEAKTHSRKSTRTKIAAALGIDPTQLDF